MAEWQDYMTTAALAEDTIALRVYHLGRLARDLDVGPAEVTARCRREDAERDLLGWALRVRGKGGHERLVPMPDYVAVEVLARPAGWLFPSPRGGHLTPHHLAKMVARWLPADYTMHTLRHRCGTVAYAATHDLRAVQELLGHAKPETTAIYTEVPGQAIRAAVEGAA